VWFFCSPLQGKPPFFVPPFFYDFSNRVGSPSAVPLAHFFVPPPISFTVTLGSPPPSPTFTRVSPAPVHLPLWPAVFLDIFLIFFPGNEVSQLLSGPRVRFLRLRPGPSKLGRFPLPPPRFLERVFVTSRKLQPPHTFFFRNVPAFFFLHANRTPDHLPSRSIPPKSPLTFSVVPSASGLFPFFRWPTSQRAPPIFPSDSTALALGFSSDSPLLSCRRRPFRDSRRSLADEDLPATFFFAPPPPFGPRVSCLWEVSPDGGRSFFKAEADPPSTQALQTHPPPPLWPPVFVGADVCRVFLDPSWWNQPLSSF